MPEGTTMTMAPEPEDNRFPKDGPTALILEKAEEPRRGSWFVAGGTVWKDAHKGRIGME